MSTSNDISSPVVVEYSTAVETIKKERTIRIRTVSLVVQNLIADASNNNLAQFDDEGNATYEASIQRKLRVIADFFTDDTLSYEGLSDAFHNLAVDYARQQLYSEACTILDRGIALRPSAVDLLSDYILYGRNVPEKRLQCREYYKALSSLSRDKWNWRAYSFSIDHLLEERQYATTKAEEKNIKTEAIRIAKAFIAKYSKEHFDHDCLDRAYADLAGIYGAFGDQKREYQTLKSCCDTYNNVQISSMRLAEIEYSSGNYAEAAYYLSNCATSMQLQPSVNKGYVFLLRAYSNASKYFKDSLKKDSFTRPDNQNNQILLSIHRDLDTAEALVDSLTLEKSITTLRSIIEKQYDDTGEFPADNWL